MFTDNEEINDTISNSNLTSNTDFMLIDNKEIENGTFSNLSLTSNTINASYPKVKNPESLVFINKIVEQHNYQLNPSLIKFEEGKKFTEEMIKDIKFMINKDNTLTHLFWITSNQIKNWIQYFNCVLNDVTHKTNRYGMALSLFVGFDNNWRNILLAQALLADKSLESHIWIFNQLLKSTSTFLAIILTNTNPAIDAAIRQRQTILEQKISYRKIHSAYKKALQTVLQDKNKSQDLFNVLQDFINKGDNESLDSEESLDDTDDDKKNSETVTVHLQNPKHCHSRECLLSTKRLKSSHEPSNTKSTSMFKV
ncbi:21690_t:CDS:2 [Gigaspora margarita]|uniref:21690_t:CDS:1 n=1 Tax=Gigaspora margarita TaxID=4874 RepID=A0ABN7UDC6_GIGMA|nr:21690_t:CDS:2 [Gigaspora margarita]